MDVPERQCHGVCMYAFDDWEQFHFVRQWIFNYRLDIHDIVLKSQVLLIAIRMSNTVFALQIETVEIKHELNSLGSITFCSIERTLLLGPR